MNMKHSNMVYLNNQEKDWGKQFAPFINERNITAFFNEFELGIKHISMNGNPRIIFLDSALRMVRLIKRWGSGGPKTGDRRRKWEDWVSRIPIRDYMKDIEKSG